MNIILKAIVLLSLIIISPIILISIFLVWLEDGSPTIFIQERLGLNKDKFNIYKIRTMHKSTPNLGTHEVENLYYLKIGSIIRKIKIDELPQLLNFVKGDLNLVGPRPGLPNQHKLKEYREIYNVFETKPGITGLSQILGYDMSDPELLAMMDDLYIKNKSFKLDLKIFFGTFIKSLRLSLYSDFKDQIEVLNKGNT